MAIKGRTGKSLRNALASVGAYSITLVLSFIVRTALIKGLGDYYLGVNSIMTSLIAVFSLADLGLGSAINFAMYKPLAENDQEKVETYINVFRFIYRIIGVAQIVIAAAIFPFLSTIINDDISSEIVQIYILFVIKNVISYWAFAYRGSLLQANQENYLMSVTEVSGSLFSCVGQIICYWVFNNYVAGLFFLVLGQIVQNTVLYVITNRKYPHFNFKRHARLSINERQELVKNVYSLSIGKFSDTVTNNVSAVIISTFVGLVESGFFSNYQMITGAITHLTAQAFSSVTSSVGNLNALATKSEKEQVFLRIEFVSVWIYLTFSACLLTATDAFIAGWAGEDHLLPRMCIYGMVANQFTSGLLRGPVLFRDGCGLFYQGRYRPLVGGLLTLLLSILLVGPLGIAGVIWSAPISRIVVALWFDPLIVYRYAFEKQPYSFYLKMIEYSLVALVVFVTSSLTCSIFPPYGFVSFFLRGMLTFVIVQVLWFIFYRRSDEYNYYRGILGNLIKRYSKAR